MPKIVILDAFTANPGDLSWNEFSRLGELRIYDRTQRDQTIERIGDAAIVLTNKTVIDAAIIAAVPSLRYIGVLATGYDVVDVRAAVRHGIVVTNVPGYASSAVAQAAFAHLLTLTNRIELHAQMVRGGRWSQGSDFCFWTTPQIELAGRTFGIVGFGNVGRETAKIARAFGMKIIYCRRQAGMEKVAAGCRPVTVEELFATADVVTLHCPLTSETERMVGPRLLALMKPEAFLINTARGGLIDEPALADALNNGRIAGAGLDVLTAEPPPADHPLLSAKNCFITPHIAWATKAARHRLLTVAADNIRHFLAGTARHAVH